ncbi:MAG TPA: cupin domain-containing protein [Gemmatimonadaceae bacterium]|nr:cupin domain-containing protein [Gemmatimonadaceae bacterium]
MAPKHRLRPSPSERFAGPEHRIELASALDALRKEPHEGKDGHRQITVFRKGPLRLVLFAFEAGGTLPAHRAPGLVVIHVLRGTVSVRTPSETHDLTAGRILVLDPEVGHDVKAHEQADMLLTISVVP